MAKRAFVLIQTAPGKAGEVSASIRQLNGVRSVDAVSGPCDIIAVVEAEDFTELGGIVTTMIAPVSGVSRWVVCATLSPAGGHFAPENRRRYESWV